MSDYKDTKAEELKRIKSGIFMATAGAGASAAGIIAAELCDEQDEEIIIEDKSHPVIAIKPSESDHEVDETSSDDLPTDQVVICEVESEETSEIEIVATENDYIDLADSEIEENMDIIDITNDPELLAGIDLSEEIEDSSDLLAEMDDTLDMEADIPDMAYDCSYDAEILA